MVPERRSHPWVHPARARALVSVVAIALLITGSATILVSPGLAAMVFAVAFAASASVAGADSRGWGPTR